MPNLRAQASMHARQGQTPEALGARERARQDASQARPHAGGHDNPPADRRASVRHAQGMDGQHPLPDQDPRKGQNRDEPAGARLQYEANDQYLRRQPADAGDRGLSDVSNRRLADIAGHDRGRLTWAKPALSGSLPEGPESAPKPPFHCEHEAGFTETAHLCPWNPWSGSFQFISM